MFEAMERCDDSYGVLGELGREALLTYARLPLDAAVIAVEDWCEGQDVTRGPAPRAARGRRARSPGSGPG